MKDISGIGNNLFYISTRELKDISAGLKRKLFSHAADKRVFFIQKPVYDVQHPFIDAKLEEEKVWVITPHLSENSTEKIHQKLFKSLFDVFCIKKYIFWNKDSKDKDVIKISNFMAL